MSHISRRSFIHTTAASLAGAPLALADVHAAAPPQKSDTDLLIVGAGLAGLSAAISAADEGATVILIDKRYKIGGTAMGAGGSISAAGSAIQKARGIADSSELHFRDANRIGRGKADPQILKLYTENAGSTVDWLQRLGVEFDPRGPRMAPEHELYSVPRTCDAVNGGRGYIAAFARQLQERIDSRKIRLYAETTANELISKQGRVVGAEIMDGEGNSRKIQSKAVLLACGGYGSNPAMIKKHNPSLARALKITSKYATGDGIRMAEAAGAALANMDLLVPYFAGVENPPGSGRTLFVSLVSGMVSSFKGDVWINKEGRRFMNEDSASPDERERALRKIPDSSVFILFDDAMLKANKPPLLNFELLLQDGLVVKRAGSIEELGRLIEVNPGTLRETIDVYNGHVEAERDPDFSRKDLVRISVAPFYAILARGVVFMTMGGIQTNTRLQVLGTGGRIIPGLYAAGEVQGAGQWMGDGLVGGTGNGAAIVFGRLAAKASVREISGT